MRYLEYVVRFIETESRKVLPGAGVGDGELLFSGDRISDLQDESSGDWLHTNVNSFNTTEMIKTVNFMLYFTTIQKDALE